MMELDNIMEKIDTALNSKKISQVLPTLTIKLHRKGKEYIISGKNIKLVEKIAEKIEKDHPLTTKP